MAQDPGNRYPNTWEMILPSPPSEPGNAYETDPRIERVHDVLTAMGLLNKEVTALHPYGARQHEECHLMMELMGLCDQLPGIWRIPSFNRLRASIDVREGYLTHRMALQNLQHRYRGER